MNRVREQISFRDSQTNSLSSLETREKINLFFSHQYQQLIKIATNKLRSETNLSIEPAELVHMAYIKLCGIQIHTWPLHVSAQNNLLFGLFSKNTALVLLELWRKKNTEKRGGKEDIISLEEYNSDIADRQNETHDLVMSVRRTLERFFEQDLDMTPKKIQRRMQSVHVFILRKYLYMTVPEVAIALKIGEATVIRQTDRAGELLREFFTSELFSYEPRNTIKKQAV